MGAFYGGIHNDFTGASIDKVKFSFTYIIALLVMGHSYFRLFTGGFHNFFWILHYGINEADIFQIGFKNKFRILESLNFGL